MNAFLKTIIGLTCIAVLTYVGYFFYDERQNHLAAQRAAEIQAHIDAKVAEGLKLIIAEERARSEAIRLTFDLCATMADATVPYEMDAPAKTVAHAGDLAKCAELDRLSAYHRNRLQSLGIL